MYNRQKAYIKCIQKTTNAHKEAIDIEANTAYNNGDNKKIIVTNETKKIIMEHMQKNPKVTITLLAEILDMAERNVKNHIKSLKETGHIERVGPDKGGHWLVKAGFEPSSIAQ